MAFTKLAREIWRDYTTEGVPGSGAWAPVKSEIRQWGLEVEADATDKATRIDALEVSTTIIDDRIDALEVSTTIIDDRIDALEAGADFPSMAVKTWAELAAITGAGVGQRGEVLNDAGTHSDSVLGTVVNEGVYSWSGSVWLWIGALTSAAVEAIVADFGAGFTEMGLALGLRTATEKIVEASGSVSPSVYRTYSWQSGTHYEVEVIAKAAERARLNLYSNAGAVFDCTFDLSAGSASGTGASIKALGSGWYRCLVTVTAAATSSANLQVRVFSIVGGHPYTGDGVAGLCVDEVNLRVAGTTGTLLPSSKLSSATWSKQTCSVSAAAISVSSAAARLDVLDLAINGTLSGDKFVEASGSVSPSCYRSYTWASGTAYTLTVDAKAAERARLNLFSNAGAVFDCTFDLSAGSASGTGASILPLGNGWYRCQVNVTASASSTSNIQLRVFPASGGHPYTGDGSSGLYVNDAALKTTGGNLLTSSSSFATTAWSKQNMTVSADVALFGGLGLDVTNASPWQGGKWAALGTSITAANQYTSALASAIGATLINLGVSGASIGVSGNGHYGSLAIYNAIPSIPTDADLVTIEAGTNDFGAAMVPLGALGDTTTATFYGALYAAVVAIVARAPDATIVFLTPYAGSATDNTHLRVRSDSATLRQFQKAVVDVAQWTGWPVIDVGREAGINYWTAADFTSDGLHLNATGGARFADYVAGKLRDVVPVTP